MWNNLLTNPGWMTAELFVKLSAKLYAQRRHKLPDSDDSDDFSDYLSLDEDIGGAALVNNNSSEESLLDHLPPEWHAKQLNNRFAALAVARTNENGSKETVKADGVQQWLPKISHSFWDKYINKLRVNASEGGVCDLEDGYER
jgi:poly(A)-specific ribonuclease